MNEAHLHLILVHIPVVLTPFAAVLLAFGIIRKQAPLRTAALYFLIISTLFCVPAFLLGEGAEELVEHLPGISEDLIEEHEEVADIALWLSVAVGMVSLLALVIRHRAPKLFAASLRAALILALIASIALSYTAYEGGKIRHPEAYSTVTPDQAEEQHHNDK